MNTRELGLGTATLGCGQGASPERDTLLYGSGSMDQGPWDWFQTIYVGIELVLGRPTLSGSLVQLIPEEVWRLESVLEIPEDQEITELVQDLLSLDPVPVPEVESKPRYTEDPYPDWDSSNSQVISGPLGPKANFRGTRYQDWREAKAATTDRLPAGGLLQFWTLGQRWFARVRRPTS